MLQRRFINGGRCSASSGGIGVGGVVLACGVLRGIGADGCVANEGGVAVGDSVEESVGRLIGDAIVMISDRIGGALFFSCKE